MKFRFSALLFAVAVLAGCNSTTSGVPNGNSGTTQVTVLNSASSPVVGITVTISTSLNNGVPGGTIVATQATDGNGQTTFSGLPATGALCASASQVVSGSTQTTGSCHQPFPSSITLKF